MEENNSSDGISSNDSISSDSDTENGVINIKTSPLEEDRNTVIVQSECFNLKVIENNDEPTDNEIKLNIKQPSYNPKIFENKFSIVNNDLNTVEEDEELSDSPTPKNWMY